MAICTNSEVFIFCGTPADVQTTQGAAITALILNVTSEVEKMLGRKVESAALTNGLFQDGLNCEIIGTTIWLKGIYRDIYSISSLTERGVAVSAATDYNQSDTYYLDVVKGCIHRISQNWDQEPLSIKISGNYGLGGASVLGDIKQAVIEMTAAKSGLWRQNVMTEGGRIETIRTTPNKLTVDSLKKYILRDC